MVCASVPAAAEAGAAMLRQGGNAVDAALAAAAALCVVEPMMTGLGGDAFALMWSAEEGRLVGLNGSGRAPFAADVDAYRREGHEIMPRHGIHSATVPGAVHAWESLSWRFGALPLRRILEPAIHLAEEGFAVTELVAFQWDLLVRAGALRNREARAAFAPGGAAPRAGQVFRTPALARTLAALAEDGAAGFYEGDVGRALLQTSNAEGGFFTSADLAGHTSTWVEPLVSSYRDVEVAELPPNGQGLSALIAMGILETFDPVSASSVLDWHRRIEAVKLAFADRDAYVADPDHVEVPVKQLLEKGYARRRAALIGPRALTGVGPGLIPGDTTYLCSADAQGNVVSFIQSLFGGFGSGIACGDTGVLLHNRGAGFRLDPSHPNALAPGKRPFHTIVPGMLVRGGRPRCAFGVMGGDVQPQGHLAFVSNLVDHGLNPQEALDRPRFRVLDGTRVAIEAPELPVDEGGRLGDALAARGHQVVEPGEAMVDLFGGGQAVLLDEEGVMAGASDRRKDGCAVGLD